MITNLDWLGCVRINFPGGGGVSIKILKVHTRSPKADSRSLESNMKRMFVLTLRPSSSPSDPAINFAYTWFL